MFINKKNKLYFLSIVGLILSFLILKSLTIFNIIKSCFIVDVIEVVVLLLVLPFLFFIMYDQMKHVISTIRAVQYSALLNELLVTLSRNSHFYEGNLSDGSKTLTSEVSKKMRVDRCSIWLYNKKRTSLICHQLYVKNEGSWYDGDIIYEKDYKPYFKELKENPVIVANDVTTHSATTCFNETYTTPLGIKSMLDVPILYRGDIIGVICLECTRQVEWSNTDITFTKMLASLFAFAYSVNQINQVKNELFEFEHFIDSSVLVSKTDKNGRIIYVNEKFEDVFPILHEKMKPYDK
jgi:transcriptional regulator with GAF, ATPase, and Fis domain